MSKTEIAEHYHCGIIEDNKDESLIELTVAQDNEDWCVFDDWNELGEDKILFRSKSKEDALFECYKILCTRFKVKYIIKGAGCPNSFLENKTVADFTQGGQK
jgi:hypothetical protein